VSAEVSHLTVVGVVDDDGACQPLPKTAQVFPARLDAPAVVVDSTTGGWPILVPRLLRCPGGPVGASALPQMGGGNYAAGSDSRAGSCGSGTHTTAAP